MKIILFARHAKSDWHEFGASDFDRTLNSKGESDATAMAKQLQKSTYLLHQIISSDAVRALTTAKTYQNLLTPEQPVQSDHALYLASHKDIVNVVENIDDKQSCVMLVGHNPGMTEVVEYYIGQSFQAMPACSVAAIGFDVAGWNEIMAGSGKLLDFEYPGK